MNTCIDAALHGYRSLDPLTLHAITRARICDVVRFISHCVGYAVRLLDTQVSFNVTCNDCAVQHSSAVTDNDALPVFCIPALCVNAASDGSRQATT